MNIFNFIKSNIPILNVVQEYTNLKQTGTYWKGVCPFHSERTASFTVSPNREIYYCFGCQSGGDVISFVAKVENCSQFEAAKFLSEKHNIQIPTELLKEFNNQSLDLDEKNKYFKICDLITKWCNLNLLKNSDALSYLEKRSISKESIKTFNIGFFEPGQKGLNSLNNFLKKENILFQDLAEFSIIVEGNSGFYSPFEDRIIFPIKNNLGDFCAFGGRIFKENDERAKYYNSKENPYFNKGSILFGLFDAKKIIQKEKAAFLVEGYTDLLAMNQAGYKNTVATLGTACTPEHLKILSRFTDTLYIVFDGDNAGQKAILRLTELAWEVNLELRVINLPEKEDPASFFNKNLDFKALIAKSKNIYQFFIDKTKSEFINSSLSEKLNGVKKVTNIIDQLDDPIKKTLLFQEVSKEFNIPLDLIIKKEKSIEVKKNTEKETSIEKTILGAILNDKSKLNILKKFEILEFFPERINLIFNKLEQTSTFELKDFINSLEEDNQKFTLQACVEYDQNLDFNHLINQFQKKNWKKIILKLKSDLIQEKDPKKITEKLEILKDWQRKFLSGSYDEKTNK